MSLSQSPTAAWLLQREQLLSYEGGLVTLPQASDGGHDGTLANADVREQAAWALGNVAGDSEEACRLVLEEGALGPLLQLLDRRGRQRAAGRQRAERKRAAGQAPIGHEAP